MDGWMDIWIDRKQYFVFLLKIVNGSALYKRKGIEKNVTFMYITEWFGDFFIDVTVTVNGVC